jgi:hypothetical protein
MNIVVKNGLPFTNASLTYRGQTLTLTDVLLDTGSAGCVFAADKVERIDLLPEPNDRIEQIRGVGGTDFVFAKHVDQLRLDDLALQNFEVEIGAMQYGFALDGIIGLDFFATNWCHHQLIQTYVIPSVKPHAKTNRYSIHSCTGGRADCHWPGLRI